MALAIHFTKLKPLKNQINVRLSIVETVTSSQVDLPDTNTFYIVEVRRKMQGGRVQNLY